LSCGPLAEHNHDKMVVVLPAFFVLHAKSDQVVRVRMKTDVMIRLADVLYTLEIPLVGLGQSVLESRHPKTVRNH
jgi:hypothetical protein